jgi:tRNA-Thr(GGU) m(6)t(6)A37 methyltransferase TsaA
MDTKTLSIDFEPIGIVRSSFHEKFGIPRQPALAPSSRGCIEIEAKYRGAFRGLSEFSHIWVIYLFHDLSREEFRPTIRPPRLGGKTRMGVYATRTPHRKNPIGLSVVRLLKVDEGARAGPRIYISELDILDGSPVLDIKPYLPYADSVPDAAAGFATDPIPKWDVFMSEEVLGAIDRMVPESERARFRCLIKEMLQIDPRPRFLGREDRQLDETGEPMEFAFLVEGFDVVFRFEEAMGGFVVTGIHRKSPSKNV